MNKKRPEYSGLFELPVIILLISQLHQQLSCNLFEKFLMFFSEVLFPAAGFARAEGVTLLRLNGIHQNWQCLFTWSWNLIAGLFYFI